MTVAEQQERERAAYRAALPAILAAIRNGDDLVALSQRLAGSGAGDVTAGGAGNRAGTDIAGGGRATTDPVANNGITPDFAPDTRSTYRWIQYTERQAEKRRRALAVRAAAALWVGFGAALAGGGALIFGWFGAVPAGALLAAGVVVAVVTALRLRSIVDRACAPDAFDAV